MAGKGEGINKNNNYLLFTWIGSFGDEEKSLSSPLRAHCSVCLVLIRVIYLARKWGEKEKRKVREMICLSLYLLLRYRHLLKGRTLRQADQVTTPDTLSLCLSSHCTSFASSSSFSIFFPLSPFPASSVCDAVDETKVWSETQEHTASAGESSNTQASPARAVTTSAGAEQEKEDDYLHRTEVSSVTPSVNRFARKRCWWSGDAECVRCWSNLHKKRKCIQPARVWRELCRFLKVKSRVINFSLLLFSPLLFFTLYKRQFLSLETPLSPLALLSLSLYPWCVSSLLNSSCFFARAVISFITRAGQENERKAAWIIDAANCKCSSSESLSLSFASLGQKVHHLPSAEWDIVKHSLHLHLT